MRDAEVVSLFPVPSEADFCARGGRFGPHNSHLSHGNPALLQRDDLVYLNVQAAFDGARLCEREGGPSGLLPYVRLT